MRYRKSSGRVFASCAVALHDGNRPIICAVARELPCGAGPSLRLADRGISRAGEGDLRLQGCRGASMRRWGLIRTSGRLRQQCRLVLTYPLDT
jgi:hypothetical protein